MITSSPLTQLQLRTTAHQQVLLTQLEAVAEDCAGKATVTTAVLDKLPAALLKAGIVAQGMDASQAVLSLTDIITQLKSLSIAKVTIPYQPTISQVNELAELVQSHLGSEVVIDIAVDPTLGAGVALETKSGRSECSLRVEVAQQLENKRKGHN